LPIVAANVGPAEARSVMRDGLAAHGFVADVPAAVMQAHTEQIVASHCGMVNAQTAGRMALAQVARDQFMARVLQDQARAGRSVVLLAGNGHVRADIGVPRWLAPDLRARTRAVGVLETDGTPGMEAAFDTVLHTTAQPRTDPCIGLRMPAAGASAPA